MPAFCGWGCPHFAGGDARKFPASAFCIVTFMVKAMHISQIFNRESIAKIGLIPTKIDLPWHLESFKEDRMCTEDGKALYTWLDSDRNEKFIRDMIFCHIYIHPRNTLALYMEETSNGVDFRKFLNENMAPWNSMIYDVYVLETVWPRTSYFHAQTSEVDIYSSTYGMPDEYAHDNKVLCMMNKPQKKIRRIGQAEYYYDNGHNIRIIR